MDRDDAHNSGPQPNDASNDQPTVPDLTAVPAAGQDRRTFLKAAVVASAAVAAAGGAAGAALLSGGKPVSLLPTVNNVCNPQCSGGDPCSACLTDSAPDGQISGFKVDSGTGKSQNPGDFLFWITNTTAAAGYYQLTVSVTGNGHTANPITASSSPFQFKTGNGDVYVNAFSSGATVQACPNSGSGGGGNSSGSATQYDTLTQLNQDNSNKGYHLTSAGKIQFGLHLNYSGGALTSSPTTFTFTFTLSYSATGSGAYTAICSSDTYTVSAKAS
jgi:hypothetical protein